MIAKTILFIKKNKKMLNKTNLFHQKTKKTIEKPKKTIKPIGLQKKTRKKTKILTSLNWHLTHFFDQINWQYYQPFYRPWSSKNHWA